MGNEWKEVTVEEIAAQNSGAIAIGPFGSKMKSNSYVSSGIPVIRGMNIGESKGLVGEFVYITPDKAKSLGNANVYKGDLVFPHRGAIGKVGIISGEGDYEHCVLSSSLMKLTVDPSIALPEFIFYYFRSNIGVHEILKFSSTVGTPGIGQPLTSLKSMKVYLPSLLEQQAIAHILGAFDVKITLNRRQNDTLEHIAQALFQSWFVDFDPVIDKALAAGKPIPEPLHARAEWRKALGERRKPLPAEIQALFPDGFGFNEELGWVPEGWRVGTFDQVAEVKYGKDHKKLDDGGIPVYGSGGIMRFVNTPIYKGESVLIPRKGSLNNLMYVNEAFWSVDTMFYTIIKPSIFVKYLYYFLKRFDFVSMNVGSAVPSMTAKVLNSIATLFPEESVLKAFDDKVSMIFEKIKANDAENKPLESLRDTLLPKLISGELRLPEAEKILRDVL